MTKPTFFSQLPAHVRYDERLSDSEKVLYSEILALTDFNGYCTALNRYFADVFGVSKNTISRRINKLKDFGFIEVEMVYRDKEIIGRKIYAKIDIHNSEQQQKIVEKNAERIINIVDRYHADSDDTPIVSFGNHLSSDLENPYPQNARGGIVGNGVDNSTLFNNIKNNNIKNNNINNTAAADAVPDGDTQELFSAWWNLYGKKIDAKKCRAKFERLLKDGADFDDIMNGTKKYLATVREKKYQKNPLTFLNGENWNDDYEVSPEQNYHFDEADKDVPSYDEYERIMAERFK